MEAKKRVGIWSSIRVRILALAMGPLVFALVSYSYLSTALIAEDKVGTVYQHSLTQLRVASEALKARIQQVLTTGQLIALLDKPELAAQIFEQNRASLGIDSLVVLRPESGNRFAVLREAGASSDALLDSIAEAGWGPDSLRKEGYRVEAGSHGRLFLAALTFDGAGKELAFAAQLSPENSLFEASTDLYVALASSRGALLASRSGKDSVEPGLAAVAEAAKAVAADPGTTGVRELTAQGEDLLVGFHKELGNLVLLTFAPKASAFAAATRLVRRSAGAGVLAVAFAVLLAALFARSLTARIGSLWVATQKVRDGDFRVRIDLAGQAADEIADLGSSFNAMAERIDELVSSTAAKARMEKELETAHLVQSRYSPNSAVIDPQFQLDGRVLAASECSGDWWHYARVGDHLIVAIGDVTGHGVSSALVTAAVHATFMGVLKYFEIEWNARRAPPNLEYLLRRLDHTVYTAGGGSVLMTFLATAIDLRKGEMRLANAAHRPLYLCRGGKLQALNLPLVRQLGENTELNLQPSLTRLESGDVLLWYTDGLLECTDPSGKVWSRRDFHHCLTHASESTLPRAQPILKTIIDSSLAHLGESAKNLEDDITVIVGAVPETATFEREEPAAQAA